MPGFAGRAVPVKIKNQTVDAELKFVQVQDKTGPEIEFEWVNIDKCQRIRFKPIGANVALEFEMIKGGTMLSEEFSNTEVEAVASGVNRLFQRPGGEAKPLLE